MENLTHAQKVHLEVLNINSQQAATMTQKQTTSTTATHA